MDVSSADVCSGSVMLFDVIAVNMTPESFAFVELGFAPWKGQEVGARMWRAASQTPPSSASPHLQVAGSEQLCMPFKDGPLLCCMFLPGGRLKLDSVWNTIIALRVCHFRNPEQEACTFGVLCLF